jgi:TRAP-type C4-dicarboxylate transport system substrate-binding protein
MTDVPLIYLIGAILIKKNALNELSSDHQQVFMELCAKYMDQLKIVIRKENQEAIQVMAKHGVKLIQPSEDQIEGFKEVSRNAMNRQTGKSFSAKVKDEIIAHLAEYRKAKK